MMSLVIVALGFILGVPEIGTPQALFSLFHTLLGSALIAGGSFALNQTMECHADAKMLRTRHRPIPSGRITPFAAMMFGTALTLAGVFYLVEMVNLISAFVGLLIAFLYVLVYTPLKARTWLNTPIGAIPGALPPMLGWAAATGNIGIEAWILFAILFFWQHPHFYAIAWIYRDDYARGGFQMLPVIEPSGARTVRQILFYALFLIPISILPFTTGMTGWIYLSGTLFLGFYFLLNGIYLAKDRTISSARKLLKASLIYLPALLGLIVVDAWIA